MMISDVELVRDCLDQEETEARLAMDELVRAASFPFGQARAALESAEMSLNGLPAVVRSHIARYDPPRALDEIAMKRADVNEFEATVQIRDRAAARIRVCREAGRQPAAVDLEVWDRANREVTVLETGVRRMAEMYRRRVVGA